VGSGSEVRACLWTDSSMLTVTRVFPAVGGRLLAAAAREWPFRLKSERVDATVRPRATVIMSVAGLDRRAPFEVGLRSFYAQSVSELEIVGIEHSAMHFAEWEGIADAPCEAMAHRIVPVVSRLLSPASLACRRRSSHFHRHRFPDPDGRSLQPRRGLAPPAAPPACRSRCGRPHWSGIADEGVAHEIEAFGRG